MVAVTRDQRKQLEELLLRLPNINDPLVCRQLLVDLPRALQQSISLGGAPAVDVRAIVDTVIAWESPRGEDPPLLLLLDNAADMVRGSRISSSLQALGARLTPQATTPTPDTTPAEPSPEPRAREIRLTREQRRELYNALVEAFPRQNDLAKLVAFDFGENLAVIAGGDTLSSIVYNLMQWAEAHGRISDLIDAAVADRPNNTALRAVAESLGLQPPSVSLPVRPPAIATVDRAEAPDRAALPYDVQDQLLQIIRQAPPFALGDARERVSFMRSAGLSPIWIANYNWGGTAFTAATQLVDAAANQGIPLQGRPGYTALGAILARLIADEMVGVDDARYLARLVIRHQLIDPTAAQISPPLRDLLAQVR